MPEHPARTCCADRVTGLPASSPVSVRSPRPRAWPAAGMFSFSPMADAAPLLRDDLGIAAVASQRGAVVPRRSATFVILTSF